ncbi:MAG: type II toxin-antitoxin system PemK/MazF family toxin [Desulfuromonadales bacterium]|nr:type II toxin-antitoxin system PemK/MazF family toxin [Desulfuromonadales bacterium]
MIQGEIWLINLDPTVGAEIKKIRPCAIVSDNAIGALPLKIIAPFTDFKERYRVVPWMVVCEPDSHNNLSKVSALDLFQVRCVAEERLIRSIGRIDSDTLLKVQSALKTVFGIR